MTRRLDRYVGRLFAGRAIGAALAFTALMQVLDLLDAATEVMERGRGLAGIGYYAVLRLPVILERIFPLAVLVGALLTFARLARHNEIVAMRTAGLSIFRLTRTLLPAVIAVAGLHLVMGDQVVPRVERRLAVWWEKDPTEDVEAEKALWVRVGGDLVSIDRVLEAGTRLEGVRIYRRDADDRLNLRIYAPTAMRQDGVWHLAGASETRIASDHAMTSETADRRWDVQLRPAELIQLTIPFAQISAGSARRALAGERAAAKPPAYYAMRLQRVFAEPLAVLVMLLLATPAATATRRAGQAGRRLLAGLGLGLLFLLVDGILAALGEAGRIPPVLAAWGALGLFGAIGATILIHLDS